MKDGKYLDIGWAARRCRNYSCVVEPCVRYWECTGESEALGFAVAVTERFLAGSQPDWPAFLAGFTGAWPERRAARLDWRRN